MPPKKRRGKKGRKSPSQIPSTSKDSIIPEDITQGASPLCGISAEDPEEEILTINRNISQNDLTQRDIGKEGESPPMTKSEVPLININKTFHAVRDFVSNLNDVFGERYEKLQLFDILISKLTDDNEQGQLKIVNIYRNFLASNSKSLYNNDRNFIKGKVIYYDEKIEIDIGSIYQEAEDTTKNIIWDHLTNIYAFIDPRYAVAVKDDIPKDLIDIRSKSKEGMFMGDLVKKVASTAGQTGAETPQDIIGSFFNKGCMNDLIGSLAQGMESNELSMEKLAGVFGEMMSSIGKTMDG